MESSFRARTVTAAATALRSFARFGVLPLALTGALTILAAGGGVLVYAWTSIDSLTAERETGLMRRALDRKLVRLKEDVTSVTIWTEAYDKTARTFDPAWADINYGQYLSQYMHHDLTVVIDGRDRLIYASQGGEAAADRAPFLPLVKAAAPLIARTRAREAELRRAKPDAKGFDRAATTMATVASEGRLYLIAASTVVPEVEDPQAPLAGTDPIALSGVELNTTFMQGLAEDYGLQRARLAQPSEEPQVTLFDADGQSLGAIAWAPARPGLVVVSRARIPIVGTSVALLLLLVLLTLRIRSVSRALVRSARAAKAADQAKSAFLANMSHEIRTPLNAVLGMTQVMETGELTGEQRERLLVIRESGQVLMQLLNDVLDLSKIEAGRLEISVAPFDLGDLAEGVARAFAVQAAAKDLVLTLRVEPEAAGQWLGDASRIRQVLVNLISNAVKFTAAGEVVVRIERSPAGLAFSVSDTGLGIAQADLDRLFQRFAQADATTTRRFGGTGLGLAISQEICGLMGGALRAESRVGEGSVFRFDLPLTWLGPTAGRGESAPSGEADQDHGRPVRILIAEDNATNRLVVTSMLAPLDAEITMVEDGRAMVEAYAATRPDVVLADIQMPELSGSEATIEIRRLEAERGWPRTPIIALTANVMAHQLADYVAAGMDGHVAKPIEIEKLFAALDAALAGPGEALAA